MYTTKLVITLVHFKQDLKEIVGQMMFVLRGAIGHYLYTNSPLLYFMILNNVLMIYGFKTASHAYRMLACKTNWYLDMQKLKFLLHLERQECLR